MYHVVIIGVIAVTVYFLTLFAGRFEIITVRGHRAFWNTVLLICFLITAAAGIFLALQSNYKWDIQGLERILNWHVEFGIALSLTAVIHLSWHLGYYKKIFTGEVTEKTDSGKEETRPGSKSYRIILLLLGFLSGAVQVIFIREALNMSGGYEIAAGVVFASWIIISAFGAWAARRKGKTGLTGMSAFLPLSSLISLALFVILSKTLIAEGVTPSILHTLVITILALLPFCFLSGYLFVRLSIEARSKSGISAGRSFALETSGGMISGILISILTGSILGNFQILFTSVFLYYIVFFATRQYKMNSMLLALSSIALIAVLVFRPDNIIRNILLDSVKVVQSTDSRYGNIATGTYRGERSIFYNHRLIDYEQDVKEREENIHYAMVQLERPANVMIISGGIDKHVREVLKYPSVKKITYLERDPAIIAATGDSSGTYREAELEIVNDDAFSFIKDADEKYDVIISLLSQPDNIVSNRFYTREFFSNIKSILTENGILMIKSGAAGNYMSDEEISFISSVYNSLDAVFEHTTPLKGLSVYLLSGSEPMNTNIPELIQQRSIENDYVNRYYLDNNILAFDSDQIRSKIDSTIEKNTLNRPVAVFHNQKFQIKKTGSRSMPFIIVLAALLLIPFFTGSNDSRTMYSTSLNLAGTEILALIIIQSTAGNFYQLAGLLIAVVMAGLAIGSSAIREARPAYVNALPALLGSFALIIALLSPLILGLDSDGLAASLALATVALPALAAGYYYRNKTSVNTYSKTISSIYFADLCGAALGFLIIAGLIVPLAGIKTTFYILAIINFASYITARLKRGLKKDI